jgi:phosphate/phosphite/phosphonate ABC transporter binding protein
MKKLFLLISMLVVASMVLAACAPAATPTEAPPPPEVEEPEPPPEEEPEEEPEEGVMLPDLGGREITIAVENAYIPFNYEILETGEAGGWDYDFIDEACARLNCVPVWIEFGWETMIAAVADGQFDMATDGITITEDRAKQVDFSDGYADLEQRLLVRIDEDRFENIEELAADPELLLSQQVNTTNSMVAEQYVSEDRIIGFDTYGLAIQAVVTGDTDASVVDETAGQGYVGENADKLKLIGPSLSSDQLGFIFPIGSDLVEPFNLVLADMKADGTLEKINETWFAKTTAEIEAELPELSGGAYEEPEVSLGTEDAPIKVLFVPSVNVDTLIESADGIEAFFSEATGLVFEASVPTSYAAALEEMCASPTDTIGFIPAMGYALANQLCGVEPALASERRGWTTYWTQYIVPRDSDIETLADLEGKTWGLGEFTSTSGYLYPSAELAALGITPGDQVETGGHGETARAVYDGDVEFGTTFFSPWSVEGDEIAAWDVDDPPDIPDEFVEECALNADGILWCGPYRLQDARSLIREQAPDVVQKVRILSLTKEIPNDTMSWSPDFPEELKQPIVDALIAYLESPACQEEEELICSPDHYEWTAAAPIFDENFDGIRILMEAQGISLENIGE